MKQYGYIKTFHDEEGNPINFKADLVLLLLYKSYTGNDLVKDILKFAEAYSAVPADLDPGKLSIEEGLNQLKDLPVDMTFILNLMAIMFINALPQNQRNISIEEAIACIPPYFVTDQEILGEIVGLAAKFVGGQKKKLR